MTPASPGGVRGGANTGHRGAGDLAAGAVRRPAEPPPQVAHDVVGIIGGTGLYRLLDGAQSMAVDTPYGVRRAEVGRIGGRRAAFLPRHGAGHETPPHRLDPRATLLALRGCGADAVLAVNNCGALRADIAPGDLLVPDDMVDVSAGVPFTLFDDEVVHVDLHEPYCPHLRAALLAAARAHWEGGVHESGTYVQVRGPRFETRAEARLLATLGDVVGMTGGQEPAIAREAGLCFAALCFVANPATTRPAGVQTAQEVQEALAARLHGIQSVLADAVARVPRERDCACRHAPRRGRMGSDK